MEFLDDLKREFSEADKPHLFMWMIIWLLETNVFFYISSRTPQYLTLDYVVVYVLIAIITTSLLKPLRKN